MRQAQMYRMLTGFLVGIGSHFLYQTLVEHTTSQSVDLLAAPGSDCKPCKNEGKSCPPCGPETVIMDHDPNIVEAYKPKGMYEITRWYYFDEKYLYDIINGEPKVKLLGGWLEETKAVTQVALEYINVNKMLGKTWKLIGLQNGYLRTDVFRGTDYILDLIVSSVESMESESIKTTFRVKMVHAFEAKDDGLKMISHTEEPGAGVHIIVPVSANEEALSGFIKLYTEKRSQKDKLTLVLFQGKGQFGDESITLKEKVEEHMKKFPSAEIHYMEVEGDYNFLQAVSQAASKVDKSELILTLNLDMHFGQELLQTCRLLAQPGKRVYFPIAFSQYDPEIIEKGMPPGKPKNVNKMDINKFTGYWMLKTHSFMCSYSEDLVPVLERVLLSMDSSPGTSHFSDEGGSEVYNNFLSNNFEVISSVEPDLIRLFRHRQCDKRFMVEEEYNHCFKTAAEMLGSKPTLSILYLTEIALKQV